MQRIIFSIAGLFALRMFGLFMILPVFAIYAQTLANTTPTLIGVALGIYGFTQAALQIPFGLWSDKIGRKPVIAFGLILFGIGSCIAAASHSIWGVILGRSLQGAGAIGSTSLALLADLTTTEQRTKAMAMIGMTIGISFSIALLLGPILNNWIGVNGIFWLTAFFAVFGLIILKFYIPSPSRLTIDSNVETIPNKLISVLKNRKLLPLDLSILLLHALLTAIFVALPLIINNTVGIPEKNQWWIYFPVLLFAFLAAIPAIIIAEKKQRLKQFFIGAIILLGITQLLFLLGQHSVWMMSLTLWLFFTAFTFLEAILPSMLSKTAPAQSKGTAMGVYSSCQFLGIFVGGLLGGILYHHFSSGGLFVACMLSVIGWLYLII